MSNNRLDMISIPEIDFVSVFNSESVGHRCDDLHEWYPTDYLQGTQVRRLLFAWIAPLPLGTKAIIISVRSLIISEGFF